MQGKYDLVSKQLIAFLVDYTFDINVYELLINKLISTQQNYFFPI